MTFWHQRRVMVTGGNGFLGKNVVRKLNERGAAVFIADHDRYDPSASLRACLRHLDNIRRALKDAQPQMVIHLAARIGGIRANREHPAEFFGACPESL
ncbi:MAG: NAD-dependent epimerase/dehydratase family protein [Chloroflexi bacterium]|nr:NAD-dependent epimerase/dehydratase family protein [Chloroflexota bacterium]